MGTNAPKSQWLSYSGQTTDEWSGGIANFSNGDVATAFSVSKTNGSSSVIVQRLSSTGAVVWSLDIGADYAPGAGSVLVGSDDKVYITGGTKKGANGESGLNDSDIFAAAISSTGQKLWYKNYGIGVHEIGSTAVLDANGNILLEGRVSEVNDGYTFIKDIPNFYGAEYSSGWRGFQLRINPIDGSVSKAYTTGSGNSGGGPIAIDRSRNIAFVSGYTFGAVNGVNTVGNGDPNGANSYLIARNETTGAVLWTRMENWMRSNLVSQESENAIYLVNKGNLEKINGSTGQTLWSKPVTDTGYVLSPIAGGGVLLSVSESSGTLTIRKFDSNGAETGSQVVTHTGTLYPRSFVEQGDGTIQISGSTSGVITVPSGTTVTNPKQSGNDSFVLQINSAFSVAPKSISPIVRGNSLYTVVDGPSWTQAEANSVKLGGHLVTINDSSEEDSLFKTFGAQLPTYTSTSSPAGGLWIGLTDNAVEGSYKWVSGDTSDWFETTYKGKGGWIQNSDSSQQDYMVLRRNGSVSSGYDFDDYWVSNSSWSGTSVTAGIAETPFIRRGDSAYVIVQGPTWEEAEANAVKLGGHLVTINDASENEWIKTNYSTNSSSIWIGFNDKAKEGSWVWSSGDSSVFTAWNSGEPDGQANYKSTENAAHLVLTGGIAGKWQDIPNNSSLTGLAEIKLAPNNNPTGTPTLSGNFKAGQIVTIDKTPIQDADNFTGYTPDFKYSWEVSSNGTTWTPLTTTDATDNNTTYTLTSAEVGKQVRGVVSYLDGYGTNESVVSAGSSVISVAVVRGNSLYTIVDGPSWTQAEANSVNLGGHLVTINDGNENTFLVSTYTDNHLLQRPTVSATDRRAWFGLLPGTQAEWKWSDGSAVSYTNWISPQVESNGVIPAPANGLKIGQTFNLNVSYATDANGRWENGTPSPTEPLKGIAETPFIRRGDSAYVIVQGPTWEEAEANAVKLGGHLVTINDAAENDWVFSTVAKGIADGIWLGATDKDQEGTWKWADGTPWGFTNWAAWQPDNAKTYDSNGEDYLQFVPNWGVGTWNDITPKYTQYPHKTSVGIAEIKLVPNNKPTGTPTLSGTLKAGQVITIDKTAVQDVDNFTGYTPDYKYSWEVSTNGSTWTQLTTADATDNNTTYTLTTAEVGKQVRGVVSYLDGYGTQESVASAGSSVTSAAVVRGNSIYTPLNTTTLDQSRSSARGIGGTLVAINTKEENDFISDKFSGEYWALYAGKWRQDDGSKKWDDNSLLTYENFQPSAHLWGPYAKIILKDTFASWEIGWKKGGWHPTDTPDIADPIAPRNSDGSIGRSAYLAETPFIRRGDSAYVIVQGPTWEEAEANALKLGGHLVTINDAAENDWVFSTVAKGVSDGIWLGGTDKDQEGTWKWVDGTPWGFTNWKTGQPDNATHYGSIGGEDYLQFVGQWGGSWNDVANEINSIPGNSGFPHTTKIGIAEIRLAPNNIPTGTPTLSGTLKAGQVITIDKTAVQDADNFTGYTPDFKYSWEASSNGTTWTPLTTTDATDNNSTYTLTTAEVGKQVRGVVSYLDGYGTQETVPSNASAAITSSAPAVQSLTLTAPARTTLRPGTSTTSSIAYNVSTGETALTGIGASLYFDSSQLAVTTAGDPFQKGLIGNAISADTNNVDGDPKTDKVLALSYADFGGQFPGAGTTLPLTLANLNLVPTASYTGTTLHLKGSPATGFTATGADLTLAYNAAPTVNGSIPAITTNRGKAFSYTVPSTLFSDADSTLTLSASTAAGTALPSWLSFNAATRTLSGTPTTGGTLNLNINAADELGAVSAPLTLKVREVQQLSSSSTPLRYQRNKDLTVPINYSTSDASSSTGLAFKVHFNSSLFSFDPNTGVSNKAQADLFQVGAVQLDTADSDNDPTTDRFIPISIASFSGQFPSGNAPTKLADLTFRSADKAIDPLTGLRDTSINFSETSVASGYGFSGTSATLKPLSFSLDVDGDGLVTPLGDGLMVIRYLFGAAFAGDALINKAISPDSPLLGGKSYAGMSPSEKAGVAAQVAANIQEGIDSKLLDVDKDGQITPLGDGLMVIRRLFGAAFDGAALTSKAISPDSPYFSNSNAASIVAANIDALKPTSTTTPVI